MIATVNTITSSVITKNDLSAWTETELDKELNETVEAMLSDNVGDEDFDILNDWAQVVSDEIESRDK